VVNIKFFVFGSTYPMTRPVTLSITCVGCGAGLDTCANIGWVAVSVSAAKGLDILEEKTRRIATTEINVTNASFFISPSFLTNGMIIPPVEVSSI
jgi:hypothetical protein